VIYHVFFIMLAYLEMQIGAWVKLLLLNAKRHYIFVKNESG